MNLISQIDNSVYSFLAQTINPGITGIMTFVSFIGSATTLIVLSLGFVFLLKNKRDSKYITINLVLVFLLNRILKLIVARERPNVLRLVSEEGYSFPSGHAMVSMGFYGFLIYLTCANIKNKKIKYPLIVFLSILILLIGISRIYLGVHYATDIIGGFVIGIAYLIIFIKFVYRS